jgi:gamma-glutamylcyclotransferase (GGCT)/AIG2-like uncharacterized protein YtfP
MEKTHLLFSYGTLQFDKVQLETYGRLLKGQMDILWGYRTEKIQITDSDVLSKSQLEFHPIAMKSKNKDDFIKGMIYEITDEELNKTDKYEVGDYQRVLETFQSGKKAWIYINKLEIL